MFRRDRGRDVLGAWRLVEACFGGIAVGMFWGLAVGGGDWFPGECLDAGGSREAIGSQRHTGERFSAGGLEGHGFGGECLSKTWVYDYRRADIFYVRGRADRDRAFIYLCHQEEAGETQELREKTRRGFGVLFCDDPEIIRVLFCMA